MTPPNQPEKPSFNLDAGSLLRPAAKRWYWVLIGGLLGAAGGVALGMWWWKVEYSASAQLITYEPPVASDAYKPQKVSGPTLVGMIRSPEVFNRVGPRMNPPVPGGALQSRVTLGLERQSEIVNVQARGRTPEEAVALANLYNQAVIELTQDQQRHEATEADAMVAQALKDTEADLAAARKELPVGVVSALTTLPEAPAQIPPKKLEQIQAAEDELAKLLLTFTDLHPKVRWQREVVARLKAELPPGTNLEQAMAKNSAKTGEAANGPSAMPREQLELAAYNVRTLDNIKNQLVARQRAIHIFKQSPPGTFRVLQEANPGSVATLAPWMKVGLVGAFFGLLGLLISGAEVLRRELFDSRLKTEADVTRVTGLPVLAHLGDIRQMSLSAREAWAFRTWIALQDRLAYSPNHGLICGITSSNFGDGRSTWISLLAGAARKCGFRVLTIATRSTSEMPGVTDESSVGVAEPVVVAAAAEKASAHANGANGHARPVAASAGASRMGATPLTTEPGRATAVLSNPVDLGTSARAFSGDTEYTALTASALFTPAMVTEKLMGPETDPLVHIPLPGWTWNLERRKQWQGALNVWRKIDNVVILVELPPASVPESVLLASNLPNLAWLVESGKSDATETRAQLETLRHARCNLVGAFINRALTPMTQGKLSRWVGCCALFALLGALGNPLIADDAAEQVRPAAATTAFSVVSPTQRAAWQQKLTLGPGDVLTFSLYGEEKELTRKEVPIGPDGRVSYLEAQNIMAAGLTVDEFRNKLNEELGKYRRAAQAYVVPVAYKSKKYYVLGKVAQRGAFPLNRPTTLIEAVAQARGMETGLRGDRSLVELADLSRSFIARGGRKLPVDFEKLFLNGDLSQNVALEPNDYIYFPGTGQTEVFVLGAVRLPGAYAFTSSTGALGAISARGGFTERAWKQKLLVIRGSLGNPETFIVNSWDVINARTPDLKLQPKDIVYVSERPWIRAEELLDAAASAFVTSAVVVWTGMEVTTLPTAR
jgi:protein involved in polysaccharide export with SLBB domain/capsular polysaccharide biosynthesis protein